MKKKGILVLGICFLGIIIFSFGCFKKSEFFQLNQIVVKGNKTISAEEIVKLGKMKLGRNIYALNLKQIQNRLLLDGRIKKVNLARKFPSRLLLEIEEPQPIFLVNLDNLYGLTDKGEVLLLKDTTLCLGIPLVTGFSSDFFVLNRKLRDQKVCKLLELYKALAKLNPDFFEILSEVNISDPNNFVLFLISSGTKIFLGMENFERKLKTFFQIYRKESSWDGFETIDLRFNREMFLKPKHN